MRAAHAAAFAGTLAMLACVPAARGQDIAQRIKTVDNGVVNLLFASKPGVCGDGETFISMSKSEDDYHWRECRPGPVLVTLRVDGGDVTKLETHVGGAAPSSALLVSTKAATDYLLDLAENGRSSVGKHALFPALLADSVQPWPQLLQLARKENVSRDVRKSAIFWLSQAAGDKAAEGLKSLLSDDDVDIRKHAVFALAQLKDDQGVPALIDAAKTSKDPEVRKSAFFWLGQKNDPRVLALYEEILLKK